MEHADFALLLGLVPLFPLLGFLFNGLVGRRVPLALSGGVATLAIGASFVSSVLLFFRLTELEPAARHIVIDYGPWLHVGGLSLDWTLQLDPLSMLFALFVSGVATLIHLYSVGYMGDEPSYARYFAYLNLFCFSMLMLVLGGNYLVMFLGWEGVGLCSYLLIGFWFGDMEKAIAGKKAFVVNRIGDFGFLVAMFLMYAHFGSLEYGPLFAQFAGIPSGDWLPTAIALFLFIGATGKSAQIPLYVWLPDAMAGPTPVSALIHAATMVTAGVYMIARSHVIYTLAPTALAVVAVVGALTALFAATMGLAQNDIKKVLAYSTVSQLGYMFLGMGVGAYTAGLFHVVTHAFFKALLFLGSGAVIHAMHHVYHEVHDHSRDAQDMRNMGGLKKHLPITYWTFAVGTIAIAGFPPLSGFFSKDEILWKTWESGHAGLWVIGFLAAGLTSFYMFRLFFMTFHGSYRGKSGEEGHFKENPLTMTLPLMVLAVLAAIAGFWGLPHFLDFAHIGNRFDEFLAPVFHSGSDLHLRHMTAHHANVAMEWLLAGCSVAIAIVGLVLARRFYLQDTSLPGKIASRWSTLYRYVYNKWYVDELYETLVIRPMGAICDFLWKYFDMLVIDGLVNGLAQTCAAAGSGIRRLQGGSVAGYLTTMAVGAAALIGWVFYF